MKSLIDVMQSRKKLKVPEIRVWHHNLKGDDYFRVFENVNRAVTYIKRTKSAERLVCLAVNGREYVIYEVR